MRRASKPLCVMVMMMVTFFMFTSSAYAAETLNSDGAISTETVGDSSSSETVTPSEETSAAAPVQETEVLPGEGLPAEEYYIDEQDQVYYEEPDAGDEDIVIEDIQEEEPEEAEGKEKEEKKEAAKKPSYSEKDLRLLASLIYAEAGNQSYEGMLAVANVVLNRVKSNAYWHVDTIEEVIYDHKWSVQFSVTVKNKKTGLSMLDKALKCYDTGKFTGGNPEAEKKAMKRAIKAAKAALEGTNNIGDYLCFQSKSNASSIKKKYSDYKIIGCHIFFRTK